MLDQEFADQLKAQGSTVLWIQGWQVLAYWQAIRVAKHGGIQVWLRAESNDLARTPYWKRPLRKLKLTWLFRQVDRFLFVGNANRRLYLNHGAPEARLHWAPYGVDNQRFERQSDLLRLRRAEIRKKWSIPDDAFCILFCGKFEPKKRPMDLVGAARLLAAKGWMGNLHLLFVGSGELDGDLRAACRVSYDEVEPAAPTAFGGEPREGAVSASFAGFLNQSEVAAAYVAADCLVLPSDFRETWGLVVNEAMATGLPCIVSDQCGCAEDLVRDTQPNLVYRCGSVDALAASILSAKRDPPTLAAQRQEVGSHSIKQTAETVAALYLETRTGRS